MKVLVTGATGFVGRAVVENLLRLSPAAEMTLMLQKDDLLPAAWADTGLRVQRGDVGERDAVMRAVEGQEVVLHLAGLVSHRRRDRDALIRTNVIGARHIAEACLHYNVRRLVHVSSVGAVGMRTDGVPADEKTSYNWPGGFVYMESKRDGQLEVLRSVEDKGLNAVVLNPASIMGPGDPRADSAHNRLYRLVHTSPVLPCFAGGLGVVDVRDVAGMILALIEKGQPGRCYIACGANVTYHEVLTAIAREFGQRRRIFCLPGWMLAAAGAVLEHAGDLLGLPAVLTESYGRLSGWHCYYDNRQSCTELNWRYIPFERTIADGCRFWLDNYAVR